jgi:transcriptional regulator
MTESREQSDQDALVLKMREEGVSWLDIARALNLTRQQARYAYQRAKREVRRSRRAES